MHYLLTRWEIPLTNKTKWHLPHMDAMMETQPHVNSAAYTEQLSYQEMFSTAWWLLTCLMLQQKFAAMSTPCWMYCEQWNNSYSTPKISHGLEKHLDKEETFNQVFVAFAKYSSSSHFRPFVFNCPFIWRAVGMNAHQAAYESDVLKRSNQGHPTTPRTSHTTHLGCCLKFLCSASSYSMVVMHQSTEKIITRPAVR